MPWPSLAAVVIGLFCQPAPRVCEFVHVRAAVGEVNGPSAGAIPASALRAAGLSSSAMLARASAMVGAPFEHDTVFVNGLAVSGLPPGNAIATVTVNDDVFSAQWADAGTNRLDITTAGSDRAWRWTADGLLPARSGSTRDDTPRRRSWSPQVQVSGPLPLLPFTFQAAVQFERSRLDVPAPMAVAGAASLPAFVVGPLQSEHVEQDDRRDIFATIGSPASAARRLTVSVLDDRWHTTNMNPAPLAENSARATLEGRLSTIGARIDIVRPRLNQRHLLSVTDSATGSAGDVSAMAVSVLDLVDAGGGADLATRMTSRTITSKHVWAAPGTRHRWLVGIDVSMQQTTSVTEPNPNGRLVFGSRQAYLDTIDGARSGTWFWSAGTVTRRAARHTLAIYGEQVLASSDRSALRGGLRLDGEAGADLRLLPRLSAIWHRGPWTLHAGAGRYVSETDTAERALVSPADAASAPRFVALHTSIQPGLSDVENLTSLESRLDPGLTRRDTVMTRIAIERGGERGILGVEHLWLHAWHQTGVRRHEAGGRFVDLLESDRHADRQQIQAHLRAIVGHASVFANGSYVIARDDVYGWGRTAGVPRYSLTWGVDARLPGDLDVSLFGVRRGGAAYDIRSGLDVDDNGLFEDRGGLPPNSGVGPRFSSIDLTVQRRMRVRLGPLSSVVIGLRASNILDTRNDLRYGSITRSPLFGRPLGAMPGRGASVSVTFSR